MGLFQHFLHGFGFTLGSRAADEVVEELKKPEPPPETARARRARERREARARAKAARKRAAAQTREKKEIDDELDRLKRRVSRDG